MSFTRFADAGEVRTYLVTTLGKVPHDVRIGPDPQGTGWSVAVPDHHSSRFVGEVQDALSGTDASLGWVD